MTQSKFAISLAAVIASLALTQAASASTPSSSLMIGLEDLAAPVILAKHGADDPAGDDRRGRGRGKDDGPGHTSLTVPLELINLAKHGADDPAGDDRRGRGCGKDDGPNHA